MIGMKRSARRPGWIPLKPSRAMPTTVSGCPLTTIVLFKRGTGRRRIASSNTRRRNGHRRRSGRPVVLGREDPSKSRHDAEDVERVSAQEVCPGPFRLPLRGHAGLEGVLGQEARKDVALVSQVAVMG